jgi:hypothetical protein
MSHSLLIQLLINPSLDIYFKDTRSKFRLIAQERNIPI